MDRLSPARSPIMALDAAYGDANAASAAVLFADWDAEHAISELQHVAPAAAAHEPGAFYKRELPLLLALVAKAPEKPRAIIVDGYVWLSGEGRPGLGAHLYEVLGGSVPVIGVAKTRFHDDDWSASITRGGSNAPLYITAAGIPHAEAAANIHNMHGPHRLPTHLKRADELARQVLATFI